MISRNVHYIQSRRVNQKHSTTETEWVKHTQTLPPSRDTSLPSRSVPRDTDLKFFQRPQPSLEVSTKGSGCCGTWRCLAAPLGLQLPAKGSECQVACAFRLGGCIHPWGGYAPSKIIQRRIEPPQPPIPDAPAHHCSWICGMAGIMPDTLLFSLASHCIRPSIHQGQCGCGHTLDRPSCQAALSRKQESGTAGCCCSFKD